jgi:ComF family protein
MAAPLVSLALEVFASLLAPPRCAACDARVAMMSAFCPACAATTERARIDDARAIAAFVYGGAVARAIARFKYERRPDLARPLGDLLWRAVEPFAGDLAGVVVVPVPLHRIRLAERGFNQSALIAGRIARRLGARMLPLALARTADGQRQATLDRQARITNAADAFRVRERTRLRGLRILLIDDVCTTGATLGACARPLLTAEVRSVAFAVVARAAENGSTADPDGSGPDRAPRR